MKTIESLERKIEALKVLLEMSEAHKSAMIAMHQAEKEMILYTKTNFENGELRKGEYVIHGSVTSGGRDISKELADKLTLKNKDNPYVTIKIDKNGNIEKAEGEL